jgi:hypothetical protein
MVEHRFMHAVLARLAGEERAAAILGDVLEVSGTNGRIPLWTAFARTAFSLGWRRCVPAIVALAVGELMAQLVAGLSHPQFVASWHRSRWVNGMATLLALSAYASWFLLPYSVLRFGWHSRFTRVCLGVAVISSSAFPFSQSVPVLEVLTGLMAVCAAVLLSLRKWRNSVIVFVSVCVCWSLVSSVMFVTLAAVFHGIFVPSGPHHALALRSFTLLSALMMLQLCSRSVAPSQVPAG